LYLFRYKTSYSEVEKTERIKELEDKVRELKTTLEAVISWKTLKTLSFPDKQIREALRKESER
jgi:hypothetical protein